MVKIRLQRTGKRNRPSYRIVVTDSRNPRDGKVLDIVGYYDPLKDGNFKVDMEKLEAWLSRGAQMTPRVKSIVKLTNKGMPTTTQKEE